MSPRIKNIASTSPEALQALLAFGAAADRGGVPQITHGLMHLRASQINGCAACIEFAVDALQKARERPERLLTVAAWRDTPYFDESERAALALTESATRLSDRADAVPDEIWFEATRHYNEAQLASLVISIAAINTWNRLNVVTRQMAGSALQPQN
jgi:AhpD family alkylhydroperoxidase